jgi:hypothetical protein
MTLATVRGLIMDLMATGDVARTREGCEALVDLLDARLARPRHSRRRTGTHESGRDSTAELEPAGVGELDCELHSALGENAADVGETR